MDLSGKRYWLAFFILLLAGLALRANLFLLPMNDESLYAASSAENHLRPGPDSNPEHPPLAKWLLGLPAEVLPLNRSEFFRLGGDYVVLPPVPFVEGFEKEFLPPMRAISVFFSLALALLVWHYARTWLGDLPALAAFFLMLFSPNMLLYANAVMLETPFLFLFTAALLFYLFDYRPHRSLPRLLLLCLLLFLAASAKFYGFLALAFVAGMELLPLQKKQPLDFRLLAALPLTALSFLVFSYPLPKVFFALDFYRHSVGAWTPSLLLSMLSRVEPALLVLAGFAGWHYWKKDRSNAEAGSLLLLAAVFLLSIAANPYPFFRHALTLWPFLALLAAYGFAQLEGRLQWAAVGLFLLLLLEALYYAPYYDRYANPLSLLLQPPAVERTHALGVNAYLAQLSLSMPGVVIGTDDAYNLPFSFEYDARFWWEHAWVAGTLKKGDTRQFAEQACMDGANVSRYFQSVPYQYFAVRLDGLAEPGYCPALEDYLLAQRQVYGDDYFQVYALAKAPARRP